MEFPATFLESSEIPRNKRSVLDIYLYLEPLSSRLRHLAALAEYALCERVRIGGAHRTHLRGSHKTINAVRSVAFAPPRERTEPVIGAKS